MVSNIREQLERDEGRVLHPYQDSLGWWSIGVGHNIGTKTFLDIPEALRSGITDQQCDALFEADLANKIAMLDAYLPWWDTLDGRDGPRSGVLINMAYNMGPLKLFQFNTFLMFLHANDWHNAAEDLRTTLVYRQLPVRYARLATQIETGKWV